MENLEYICLMTAEIVPLLAALFATVYGIRKFFKKGKPLFLQSLTMAMASYALSCLYHLCQSLTSEEIVDGFTPAYLGRIGFFLFMITASYAQLDKIVDDGSKAIRPARRIAWIAPICAALMYIPNCIIEDVPVSTKVVYALVWIPAVISSYFNLKHAISPDRDFGFIKAIKPYNAFALGLCFVELVCLTAWDYYDITLLLIGTFAFAALCICTMVAAKKGVEKWTI